MAKTYSNQLDFPVATVVYEDVLPEWLIGECPRCHSLTLVDGDLIRTHSISVDETYRMVLGNRIPDCTGSGLLPVGNKIKLASTIHMPLVPAYRQWGLLAGSEEPIERDGFSKEKIDTPKDDPLILKIKAIVAEAKSPTVGDLLRLRRER